MEERESVKMLFIGSGMSDQHTSGTSVSCMDKSTLVQCVIYTSKLAYDHTIAMKMQLIGVYRMSSRVQFGYGHIQRHHSIYMT